MSPPYILALKRQGFTANLINTKNKKRLLGLGAIFAVYSALGFLAAPSLAIKLAQQYVSDKHKC